MANPQLAGIDLIDGTYPFDLRICNRTLAVNRFYWNMIRKDYREEFLLDEERTMEEAGLNEAEKTIVRARDWLAAVRYGVNFFVLEKFARVVRVSNLEVYAIMRGESFDAFIATRAVPDAR